MKKLYAVSALALLSLATAACFPERKPQPTNPPSEAIPLTSQRSGWQIEVSIFVDPATGCEYLVFNSDRTGVPVTVEPRVKWDGPNTTHRGCK